MTIAREEIFGPVLAAIDFVDVDEAIARANDSIYGLAAGVWTRDIKKAHYVASKLKAGTVWVNTYNVYDTAAPFGGYKQSGFGREMGRTRSTTTRRSRPCGWIWLSQVRPSLSGLDARAGSLSCELLDSRRMDPLVVAR